VRLGAAVLRDHLLAWRVGCHCRHRPEDVRRT
jgi:hypothetical protein